MQFLNGALALSATDLNNFLACEHLTTLDLDVLRNDGTRPRVTSGQATILSRLGEEHEQNYLAALRLVHAQIVTIDRAGGIEASAAATEAAMHAGASVIYQAAFYDGTWMGYADFLRRVDTPLPGGRWAWHYEVEDTKLARHTEPYFLLQLCYYSEHVARIQGAMPENMYVVLGDSTRHAFRLADFAAYYRGVKARFLARLGDTAPVSYPMPSPHCALCVWDDQCTQRRLRDDHLSLVANITRLQIGRLSESGITTLRALGTAAPEQRPPKIARDTYATLTRQARLQAEQRAALAAREPNPYKYELLARRDDDDERTPKGFARLPMPSPGDVFFDMEGDPYYDIGTGLEYLFGAYTADDRKFHAFWGCDRSPNPGNDRLAEKRAFEAFVDFVVERRRRDPDMHVYHYASYEKTALQKLAIRHATREDEVDRILREDVLVDLYAVVRRAVAVGQPSYSIKKLEDYFGKRQETSVKGGDESILRFEEWLATRGDAAQRDDSILRDLATYNEYDCVSTHGLLEWLHRLRNEAIAQFGTPIPPYVGAPPAEEKESRDKYLHLKAQLLASIPEDYDPASDDPATAVVRPLFMVLQMLEYHWREDKPIWWKFYDRCDTHTVEPNDLIDDSDSIVGLEPLGPGQPDGTATIYRLHYPPQFHKIGTGSVHDLVTKKPAGTILEMEDEDENGGTLVLRRTKKFDGTALPTGITSCDIVAAGAVRDGIARFTQAVLDGTAAARYTAAYDMLLNALPRLSGRPRGARLQPETVTVDAVRDVCRALDASYLFVQGPPGAGKTYTGARLILDCVKRGRKVGVMANSHKAIHNLLAEIDRVADELGISFRGLKKRSSNNPDSEYVSAHFVSEDASLAQDGYDIVAGTAWAFGPEAMDGRIDDLFIDEAGQIALPVAIAAATSARNIVLLGDPLQLPHVTHTAHPGDIGVSVLEHLLDGRMEPVSPERGIFLTDSYRMHPDVCEFISELLYEGRLRSAEGRDRQRVDSPGLSGTGLRFIPVEHQFNKQRSVEEAAVVANEAAALLQGTIVDVRGVRRPLEHRDIIVVTPYNAQMACIRRELHARGLGRIEVGTVDKFQGREAYVVLFSTAASSAEEASRGVSFIFNRQRFNVAISRARALAVWIGSSGLIPQRGSSIEDIRVANGVYRFLEMASPQGSVLPRERGSSDPTGSSS